MLKPYIQNVMAGNDLTAAEATDAMNAIMSGEALDTQIAAFLTALKMKGESADEIAGFARTLLAHADHVPHEKPVICNCGTGGDTKGTFNVSTAAAFVLAGGGVAVAKHGNYGVSSKSGSADVLQAMGVKIDLPAEKVSREIAETDIGFLFAPALNKAMRYVGKVRKELGMRTVFNLLGPIINPAGLDYQMVGLYDASLTHKIAEVLGKVGVKHAMVIASEDGMDEISTNMPTKVSELKDGEVTDWTLDPADYGFTPGSLDDYRGGTPAENAQMVRDIISGRSDGPKLDIVLINAAAGFYAADKVDTIADGLELARETIASGKAAQKLDQLIASSNS